MVAATTHSERTMSDRRRPRHRRTGWRATAVSLGVALGQGATAAAAPEGDPLGGASSRSSAPAEPATPLSGREGAYAGATPSRPPGHLLRTQPDSAPHSWTGLLDVHRLRAGHAEGALPVRPAILAGLSLPVVHPAERPGPRRPLVLPPEPASESSAQHASRAGWAHPLSGSLLWRALYFRPGPSVPTRPRRRPGTAAPHSVGALATAGSVTPPETGSGPRRGARHSAATPSPQNLLPTSASAVSLTGLSQTP